MVDIDSITGLPKDLVSFEDIAREQQRITVKVEKRKFGKKYTVIQGFKSDVNITNICKNLKTKFACGGTAKSQQVELQGDHTARVKAALVDLGFPEETVEVKKLHQKR
ncbi:stress response translation initiation inhibitor YciH [Candidatus Woesearchaeota archaeon]|nr:stress response translation initiation inhibitor YciH [Candidatus Woesearchaeota archaeon]MBT5739566.1 stress response translation initiation inhibitor YciH [Candidatus Woesearchaeota archaeon]